MYCTFTWGCNNKMAHDDPFNNHILTYHDDPYLTMFNNTTYFSTTPNRNPVSRNWQQVSFPLQHFLFVINVPVHGPAREERNKYNKLNLFMMVLRRNPSKSWFKLMYPSYNKNAKVFSGGEMGLARDLQQLCCIQSGGTQTLSVPW